MFDLIREENYEQTMREVVEPELKSMREDAYVPVSAGSYHAEIYERPGAARALVLLHGYTESAEKFRELTWYFLGEGYNVYAVDHRGHGLSLREVEDTSISHVEHFDDYLHDLEAFMERIVLPRTQGMTRVIYGHSMGGAVATLALMAHPDWFDKAVLNAPMIQAVSSPLPRRAAAALGALFCRLGRGRERAFIGKPFDAARETYEGSHMTSRARFDYYQKKRNTTSHLQNCSPSYAWVREGMRVTDVLLDPGNTAKIKTPLLLCQAARDTIVCLPQQEQFVSQVAGARLVAFDAKHEIYSSEDHVLEQYLNTIFAFLSE